MCQILAIWGHSQVRLEQTRHKGLGLLGAKIAFDLYCNILCADFTRDVALNYVKRGYHLLCLCHHTFPPTCGRHNSGTSFRDNSIAFTIFWLIEERQEQIYKEYAHG